MGSRLDVTMVFPRGFRGFAFTAHGLQQDTAHYNTYKRSGAQRRVACIAYLIRREFDNIYELNTLPRRNGQAEPCEARGACIAYQKRQEIDNNNVTKNK
jgi:hypothetical protein